MITALKDILLTGLLLVSINGVSQIVLTSESFGTGSAQGTLANGFAGDMGTWTVATTGTNGGSANVWYVSGEECGNAAGTCGSACSLGDNSLHISAIGGLCGGADCGAAYDETGPANETNKRAISPTVDCTNQYYIELNFNYIAAQGDDGFFVEYSLDNGATWTTFVGGNVATSTCCSCLDAFACTFIGICCAPQIQGVACTGLEQGFWTAANLSFPVGADNNNQVRFAFHWTNDGDGFGTDPSVAIDDITITYDTSLPLEMTDLEVNNVDKGNLVSWNTISESNSSHFMIEYSQDGINFRDVGRVEANENSTSKQAYKFHHAFFATDNYYRLKAVDKDGKFEHSETVYLRSELSSVQLSNTFEIYEITGLQDMTGSINVYDLGGKVLIPKINFGKDDDSILLDLTGKSKGIYVIQVATPQGNKQFKIVL